MIKNKVVFEIEKDERNYLFIMEQDSPLGEIHDVLSSMRQEVVNRINSLEKEGCKDECKQ